MKFKARYLKEYEVVLDAEAVAAARALLEQHIVTGKVLGIIPADQAWPDQESQTRPRPPRGAPPDGGSPGSPTASVPSVAHAVAA